MSVRISTLQAFESGLSGIQRNYSKMIKTQEQISSGNRILTPGDDPVASVRLIQLEKQQESLSRYQSNLKTAQSSLTEQETTLNSVNTILQSVRELAGQAGNGALDAEGRSAIALELSEYENQLLGLMNTKDAKGNYLFSGFQAKTQPFVKSADGSYSYQGDTGQRSLKVADSLTMAISNDGQTVFGAVSNAARFATSVVSTTDNTTLRVSNPVVISETAAKEFPDAGIEVRFSTDDPNSYEVYSLSNPDKVLATGKMDSNAESTDTLLVAGVSIQLDGAPAGGEVFRVQPSSTSAGKQGILDTLAQLRQSLENSSATSYDIRDSVAAALTNIDNGINSVDSARSSIGARLNVIDITQTDHDNVLLINKSMQADLREVDYAEAISTLALQKTILEAAQRSYVQINGLSLFNFM